MLNKQYGPWPSELEVAVMQLHLATEPEWKFSLQTLERDPPSSHGAAAGGLTFVVTTCGYDSYHPEKGRNYRVNHYFPVPAATYNRASWLRWLLDCLLKVNLHELCEGFTLEHKGEFVRRDGALTDTYVERPFAPTHGPGDDPYVIHEYATEVQRRTRFTGEEVQ